MRNCFTKGLCILMSMIICVSFTIGGNTLAVAESTSGDASSEASSNTAPIAEYNDNNVYTFKDKDAGVKVLVVKKDSWDNGYIADVSVENTGDKALVNWHIDLKINGYIDSVWNSEYEVKDGKIKLSYPSWKRKIDVGDTYSIGMKVNGTFGGFDDFSYYEDAKEASDLYKIEYKVRNSWDHHAVIDAVLTNIGDTTLRDWSLEMGFNADIVDIWNAGIECYENGTYLLKCKDYNADIEPNDSVVFGFQAQYEDDDIILPTDSKLVAVADSKLVPAETDKVDWYKVMTNADSDEAIRMRDNVKNRIKVAIIDSGVDYMGENDEINRVDFIGDTEEENPLYDDRSGHGTGVAGMLLGASEEDETEEEESTEAPVSDMDFSYLTDADYIEVEDADKEDSGAYEEDYDGEDYKGYEDDDDIGVEDDVDENDDYDVEGDEEIEENNVIDDEERTGEDADYEEDNLDNLNLFEYNELYGEIEGLNPNIDLTSLRVLDEDNEAPVSRVIAAIEWAIDNNINILNLSWGIDTDNAELHNVIKKAYKKGMLIIAAAGNDGEITYPAKYDEVIAVGSVDSMAKPAASSASGDGIELVAPAEDVIVYTSFGILTFASGTSYAVPQITALASILWQQDVTVSNKCIRELLRQSASPLGDSMCYGYGMADYKKAAGMYEGFVKRYDEVAESDELSGDVAISFDTESDIAEASEVSVIDEEYVTGLWGPHNEMASGNAKADEIQVLRAGLMWPDLKESGLKGMSEHPEFHGSGDYVNTYLYIMRRAKNIWNKGKWAGNKNKINVALSETVGCFEKEYNDLSEGDKNKVYISDDVRSKITNKEGKISEGRRYTAIFIMGIAMHSLGDVFSHKTYGLAEKGMYYYSTNEGGVVVKQIPQKYTRILHGKKKEELSEEARLVLGFNENDGSKSAYYDNRADSRFISPSRYLYTKKLYKSIISKKVNSKINMSSSPSSNDFYCAKTSAITKSCNLYERINDMEYHFGIKGFKREANVSSKSNADNIDMESLYEQYKNWIKVNLKINVLMDVCSIGLYKVNSNNKGVTYVKIADSSDKSSMFYDGDGIYSCICDTDTEYIVNICVEYNGIKRYAAKRFRTKKVKVNMKNDEDEEKDLIIHRLYDETPYNISVWGRSVYQIKLFDDANYSFDEAMFTTGELYGCVKDCADKKPLGGVKVTVKNKLDSTGVEYITKTDGDGNYSFKDKCALNPGIYYFELSKKGYISILGTVIVRSDLCNWNPLLYMQSESNKKCKSIIGSVTDAESGKMLTGFEIKLYKGVFLEEEELWSASADSKGKFVFENIIPGVYTIVVSSDDKNYLESKTIVNAIANKIVDVECRVSKVLKEGSIRVVLSWGDTPKDLDAHVYGYNKGKSVDHCFYGEKNIFDNYYDMLLDRDDVCGNGCETITISPKIKDVINYKVHNYSANNKLELAHSNAIVDVYTWKGDTYRYPVPSDIEGYDWNVFEYDFIKECVKNSK